MRVFKILFLFCIFAAIVNPVILHSQAPNWSFLEGRVVDGETGEPLDDVHLFLSGTKIGTVSNPAGRYRLNRIPPGFHRLVISIVGHGRNTEDLLIAPGELKTLNIELDPVVYEMDEIYAGNLDERWESYLERFERLFLGESKRADSVEILNPEVLRFDNKWWGKFTAEALAPLKIENRALGYQITYYLDEFIHSGRRTRWDGEPFFTELTPADSVQAQYWEKNREQAFYGSYRHFLKSLIEDRLEEEGFVLYHQRRNSMGFSARSKRRTSAARLVNVAEEGYLFKMQFYGRLEVIYMNAKEDERYIRWHPEIRRAPSNSQRSYLELSESSITIDATGEVHEPYGTTQFGYFSFHRIADITPRSYPGDEP